MTRTHSFRHVAWIAALSIPLLVACDRRETITPPVAAAGSEPGGSGLVLGSSGSLDESMQSPAAGHSTLAELNPAEQRFISQAVEASLYEVAAATLAIERAQNESTRKMAEKLLRDHKWANDKLLQVANGRMAVPSSIPPDKQAMIDKLSQTTGEAFDQQFIQVVGVQDHQQVVQLFEAAQKDIQNTELKLFVQSTLPTLKSHLSKAEELSNAGSRATQ